MHICTTCMYDMYVHHTPAREPDEQEQGKGQAQEQERLRLLLLLLLLLRCARERATTQARP